MVIYTDSILYIWKYDLITLIYCGCGSEIQKTVVLKHPMKFGLGFSHPFDLLVVQDFATIRSMIVGYPIFRQTQT